MVFGAVNPEKPVPEVEPRPPNVKPEVVAGVVAAVCPNGVLKVGAAVEAPNGLTAENPLVPGVPVPEVVAPRVGVPKDIEPAPLPNEKPVEPPPNKPPVEAAAILIMLLKKNYSNQKTANQNAR